MAGFRGKLDRYMEVKGVTYWFKMTLPKDMIPYFDGKKSILQSLKTGDRKTARDRRDKLERDLKDIFKAYRDGTENAPKVDIALNLGAGLKQDLKQTEDPEERYLITSIAEDREERLRTEEERQAFRQGWLGRDPVDKHVDKWLEAAKLSDKTTSEWKGLVRRFARWCEPKGYRLPDDITRKTAGEYVTEELEPMNRKTAQKHMSAIVGYWDYLIKRGLVDHVELSGNPWKNQLQPQRRKQGDRKKLEERERAFTDDELKIVLYQDAFSGTRGSRLMHDDMMKEIAMIGALSGMRLGEIVTMTVGGAKDGIFDLSKAKTEAGVRWFPIHSQLQEMIDRRREGKGDSELLFHETRYMPNAPDALSKAFGRRRKALGVTEVVDGKRRSLVNFHSFRRTFITKARHAGFAEADIADVVGHDTEAKKSMTFGVYSEGADMERRKAVVEAVTVPHKN
ncbi:hypothetical protein DK867_15930 [Ochrobactrum sp. POC9]|uniref:DUF6538 domain-containing protein n=1 Tax=Ochrobactrum sp. POC9 TaxID=2203419 RepID=UPI000D7056FF|nr:DUF6538 domain-containing protein [Ochrobactrum sp. POC9]PWU72054.1 hypothetical protein DK867_15930 [Ochrobactrum sp. POC9]